MGKISENNIRSKLVDIIRTQFMQIDWKGITLKDVISIERLTILLSDKFKYEGKGTYDFYISISLMEKINEENSHCVKYRTNSPCKMIINETEDNFEVEIIEPIIINKCPIM